MAKLANGITDTPVLMAAKAHLRNNRPLVIFLINNSMYNEKMYFILFFYDDNQ